VREAAEELRRFAKNTWYGVRIFLLIGTILWFGYCIDVVEKQKSLERREVEARAAEFVVVRPGDGAVDVAGYRLICVDSGTTVWRRK
jgi:hypothetical protein